MVENVEELIAHLQVSRSEFFRLAVWALCGFAAHPDRVGFDLRHLLKSMEGRLAQTLDIAAIFGEDPFWSAQEITPEQAAEMEEEPTPEEIAAFVEPRPGYRRYITRFTYEFTSFQGWRVAINRSKCRFVRYFSDLEYGSEEAALQAALSMRTRVMKALERFPGDPQRAFDSIPPAKHYANIPAGLKPRRACRSAKVA